MNIIEPKKPGEKGFPEYFAKVAILIFATTLGVGTVAIIAFILYFKYFGV